MRHSSRPHYELTGQRFGRLQVIKYDHTEKTQGLFWLCQCDCGNTKTVRASSLVNKLIQSCGCLQRENRHLRRGEKSPMYGRTKENNPNWRGGRWQDKDGYIYVRAPWHPNATHGGYVLEHILIMEKMLGHYLPDKAVVHHKNGIRNDNNPFNLWMFPTNGDHRFYHSREKGNESKFKGNDYYVFDDAKEKGSPIFTKEQYEYGEISYAYLYNDGIIMRFHNKIGSIAEIEWGKKAKDIIPKVSTYQLMQNLIEMTGAGET